MRSLNRREFVGAGLAIDTASALPGHSLFAVNANEEISLGFISCGSRAGQLMKPFSRIPGVKIAGLCDPASVRPSNDSLRQRHGPTYAA